MKRIPFHALLCLFLGLAYQPTTAQNRLPVTGTVNNEKGQPIESASVTIGATGKGALTDRNGQFTISAPPGSILIITYIGYDTASLPVQSTLKVTLHPVGSTLNDVVVIGYGTQKRKDLTGSLSVVTAKDFQTGQITTPEQLIAGKVAGVSVTSNGGAPGSGSVIRIRGVASLSASNDPLVVVDGLPKVTPGATVKPVFSAEPAPSAGQRG